MKPATIILLTLLFSVTALASPSPTSMNLLSIGMTKQEVIKILGAPSSTAAPGEGVEYLRYKFPEAKRAFVPRRYTEYFVRLKNGAVDQYGKMGDFDSTKDKTVNINVKAETSSTITTTSTITTKP